MEDPELKDYIFAQEKNREATTIKRLFADQGGLLGDWVGAELRWSLPFIWLGLRIPHARLLRGYNRPPKKFLGDVDVFGATLQAASQDEYRRYVERARNILGPETHPSWVESCVVQDMIMDGKTKWPPDLSYMAAVEVKAAYYNDASDLKAAGDKYNGRDQALELCRMGFDRVALARFVVTQPVDSLNHHPWMVAAARSGRAMDEYLDEPKGIFVGADDPYGTILISAGSVLGKLEHLAGGMSASWLREPAENLYRENSSDVRKAMEDTLLEVMAHHPVPRTFPVLLLACSDDKCGNVYVTGADPYALCPNCGKTPR